MIRALLYAASLALLPVFGASVVVAIDETMAFEPGLLVAAGCAILTVEMTFLSFMKISWSPLVVGVPLFALAAVSVLHLGRRRLRVSREASLPSLPVWGVPLGVLGVALVSMAAITATSTSIDFVYFWGPKAQWFTLHRGIDFRYLSARDNFLMHPDYPPLVPLVFAWSSLWAGFSWWAPILSTPLYVGLAGWSFWRLGRRSVGAPILAGLTCLFVTTLGYCLVVTNSLGNAEVFLVCWEAQALALLTFWPPSSRRDLLASVILSAAVLTKVEGAALAMLTAAAFSVARKPAIRWGRFVRLAGIPFAVLLGWMAIGHLKEIREAYSRSNPYGPFTLVHLSRIVPSVLAAGNYEAWFLPWLALLGVIALSPRPAAGVRYLVLSFLYFLFVVFCYLHGASDPHDWILVSAPRLLLAPLTVLVFGAAATWIPVAEIFDSPAVGVLL